MAKIDVLPGKSEMVPVEGRYLSIIEANQNFVINASSLGDFVGKAGRQYEIGEELSTVTFHNEGDSLLVVEYDSADIRIFGTGSGTVNIGNKLVVSEIEKSIQVTADATVENGKMSTIEANNWDTPLDVTLAPGETKLLFAPRDANNRLVSVQVISEQFTEVRLSSSNAIAANQGRRLRGKYTAPASAELSTITAVYARNNGITVATLQIDEAYRL